MRSIPLITVDLTAIETETPAALADMTVDIQIGSQRRSFDRSTLESIAEAPQSVFVGFDDVGDRFHAVAHLRRGDQEISRSRADLDFAESEIARLDLTVDGIEFCLCFGKSRQKITRSVDSPIRNVETNLPSIASMLNVSLESTNDDFFEDGQPRGANRAVLKSISIVSANLQSANADAELGVEVSVDGQENQSRFDLAVPYNRPVPLALDVFRSTDPAQDNSEARLKIVVTNRALPGAPPIVSTPSLDLDIEGVHELNLANESEGYALKLAFLVSIEPLLLIPGPNERPALLNEGISVLASDWDDSFDEEDIFGGYDKDGDDHDDDDDDHDDDGDDPLDTTPCFAYMTGPQCICNCEKYDYTVISNCAGKCIDWEIEDDGQGIATIVKKQGCVATVSLNKEGEFKVKCTYVFESGGAIDLDTAVDGYVMNHVMGDTTDSVVKTTPSIEPHPFVQILVPAATAPGESLRNGADFIIHRTKLDQDLAATEPETVAEELYEVELKVTGSIDDFFKEIERCRWEVVGQQGRLFKKCELKRNDEFTDFDFETRIPGESDTDERVVVLKGIGRHEVRVVATNPIDKEGTDWVIVEIELDDEKLAEIDARQIEVQGALSATMTEATRQRIDDLKSEIRALYRQALLEPRISVSHNFQETQAFGIGPGDMTRTQVKMFEDDPPDELEGEVKTRAETQQQKLKEEEPKVFLTIDPIKNFWVVPEKYGGGEYNFAEDGMIRGDKGTPLSSTALCCDCDIAIFGVEAVVPECTRFKKADPKIIRLQANGIPGEIDGDPGRYRFSVVAKPSEEADPKVTPDTFSPAGAAELEVDEEGTYTIKVEYMLGGRSSVLTYDLADTKAIFAEASALTWNVWRVGRYEDEIADHTPLPYYQAHSVEEPVRAAEMLIEPTSEDFSTSTGTSSSASGSPVVTAVAPASPGVADPDLVIGRKFRGVFRIPPELAFEPGIFLRAYFEPYSPDLTAADYEDFELEVDPESEYQVRARIKADRDIRALHLMNIRYKHVQRLKGRAVPISFSYRVEDEVCARSQPAASSTTSYTPTISTVESGATEVFTAYGDEGPDLVNLITFDRDLGPCRVSNATKDLSNSGDLFNACNGNLCFQIDLVSSEGRGENIQLAATYNSLHAIYQDSVDYYQRINGVSNDVVARHWDVMGIGRGFVCTYGERVRHYTKPHDRDGDDIRHYLELLCSDGNRIQFEQVEVNEMGYGTYAVQAACEAYLNAPDEGVGLTFERRADAHLLKNIFSRKTEFDENGALVRVSHPLIENTSIAPLISEVSPGNIKTTDSFGREVTVQIMPPADRVFSGQLTMETPQGLPVELTLSRGCLRELRYGSVQRWEFEYHQNLGQGDECSVLQKLKDPRGHESTYSYYEGYEFEDVPAVAAKNFWGRLGRASKGQRETRTHTWFYEGLSNTEQTLVYRSPRGIEFIWKYDVRRQALLEARYVRKGRNLQTKTLQDAPWYQPSLQNSGSLDSHPYQKFEYFAETKLVEHAYDYYGERVSYEYVAVPDSRAHQVRKRTGRDGVISLFEYDAETRFPEKISTPTLDENDVEYTILEYDDTFQLHKRHWPENSDLANADGTPVTTPIVEVWIHNPATGRLETYTDAMGTVWSFKYDEDGRDPQGLGLHTSKRVTLSGKTFEHIWKFKYDNLGHVVWQSEPQYGEEQTTEMYLYGEVDRVLFQEIETADRTLEGFFLKYDYDALFNKTGITTPGSAQSFGYNEHGEQDAYVDAESRDFETLYALSGAVRESVNAGETSTYYALDELDRVIKKTFDPPDDAQEAHPSEAFAILIEWDDENKSVFSRRYRADNQGEPTSELLIENKDVIDGGHTRRQETRYGAGGTPAKVEFDYDRWGQMKETRWYSGDQHKKTFEVGRDSWSQIIREEQRDESSSAKRASEYVRRADGNVVRHSQGSGESVVRYRHDELGRVINVADRDAVVLQDLRIRDAVDPSSPSGEARLAIYSVNPAQSARSDTDLILSRTVDYNRRGQKTRTEDGLGSISTLAYDAQGRLREETDSHGNVTVYGYDNADRVVKVERRVTEVGPVSFYGLNKDDPSTLSTRTLLLKEIEYAWNDEIKSVRRENARALNYEYDRFGRLKRVRTGSRIEQTVVYDALERVKKRIMPGPTEQQFNFNDATNTVSTVLDAPRSFVRTEQTQNWQGQIESFAIQRYTAGERFYWNQVPERMGIKFEYDGLGDLKEKIYVEGAAQHEISRLSLRHSDSGLIESLSWRAGDSSSDLTFTQHFNYDDNLHVEQVTQSSNVTNRDGDKIYEFNYNLSGLLKSYWSPKYDSQARRYVDSGSRLLFVHDEFGRLSQIVEGLSPEDSSIEMHYDRPSRTYLAGALDGSELDRRSLVETPSLKGITYSRNFTYRGRAQIYNFFQDYAYDGEGNPHSWVSHIDFRAPGYVAGNPGQEVWRTVEREGGFLYTYKRFVLKDPLDRRRSYNYTTTRQANSDGRLLEIKGERNRRNSFDTFFGRAPDRGLPDGVSSAYGEFTEHDLNSRLPRRRWLVYEDPANTENTPVPYQFGVAKDFVHDAGGRMVSSRHHIFPRGDTGTSFGLSQSGGEESLGNESHHLYGPDGEEMYRVIVAKEEPANAERRLRVTLGDSVVGAIDFKRDQFLYHETIPGVGVRLCTTTGSIPGKRISGEFYYSWDHNGSVAVVRDNNEGIVADFGIASPGGEIDQFGFGNPMQSEVSRALDQSPLDRRDLYYKLPVGIDYLLGSVASYQERDDHALTTAAEPSIINAAGNDYGVDTGGFAFREQIFSSPEKVLQGVVDGVRGFGDALTAGYASKARGYLYHGNDAFHAVRNVYSYGGGMVVGMAASVYFGAVSTAARLAQGTWAVRAAALLTIGGDILGFVDSVNNIRSGKSTAFDYLGLVAPAITLRSMQSGMSRSASIMDRIHLARNSAKIPTVQVRHLSDNEVELVINRTNSMAKDVKGQSVMNTMNEWIAAIDPNPGRRMKVSEALDDVTEIAVSKSARTFLENNGIRVYRSRIRTAAEADAIIRKVYSYYFGKTPNTQVGHVLDLRLSRGQTRLEIQTVQGIIESMASGLYPKGKTPNFLKEMLGTIFEKQHSGTNMAVGAGPTKSIARMIETGEIPENVRIVGVVLGEGWN